MCERLFSSGDVCEISGLARTTFDDWVDKGLAVPLSGGGGHGYHRRYSLMQVIGITMAANLRRNERAQLVFVKRVVERVSFMLTVLREMYRCEFALRPLLWNQCFSTFGN